MSLETKLIPQLSITGTPTGAWRQSLNTRVVETHMGYTNTPSYILYIAVTITPAQWRRSQFYAVELSIYKLLPATFLAKHLMRRVGPFVGVATRRHTSD